LGVTSDSLGASGSADNDADVADRAHPGRELNGAGHGIDQWNAAQRKTLNDNIRARRAFLDFVMHRRRADGSQPQFKISGEPMFDSTCRFTGYRGLGVEVLTDSRS
jgi:hypothetical protein